jgi:hypothetical protein
MILREMLRRQWHRYNDPLRTELGARYDATATADEVKRRAMAMSGGSLPADWDTVAIPAHVLNREVDQILEVGKLYGVSVATFSYLGEYYEARGRDKVDSEDWRMAWWKNARVARLLRDSMIEMLAEIKPGAKEVLAP